MVRDTNYATELCQPAILKDGEGEARLERLQLKKTGDVVIRLSWWKDGRMVPRPLDLTEQNLITLLAKGVRQGVLLS